MDRAYASCRSRRPASRALTNCIPLRSPKHLVMAAVANVLDLHKAEVEAEAWAAPLGSDQEGLAGAAPTRRDTGAARGVTPTCHTWIELGRERRANASRPPFPVPPRSGLVL